MWGLSYADAGRWGAIGLRREARAGRGTVKAAARAMAVILVGCLCFSGSLPWPGRGSVASAQTGGPSTTRVSISTTGQEGNGASQGASISADGRYVAFQSTASNFVSGDSNKVADIFVRDTTAQTTTSVSVTSSGKQGNAASSGPDVASQGRYVAFQSDASNLVSGDRNAVSDAFVRDLTTNTTSRVSLTSSGSEGNGASQYPSISADGRYVAFLSSAANLVTGDSNAVADVFVRDTVSGATTRVSVSSSGAQANGASSGPPAISGDGRYVAFASSASNLVPGDGNGITDIFVRDRTTGTTTRVSVSSFAEEANAASSNPAISSDGRYVAFDSYASNLAPNDLNHWADVFVSELTAGRTTRVSVTSTGADADSLSGDPGISSDGRYIAFRSAADNLSPSDTNVSADVFLHDVKSGAIERISVSSSGSGGSRSSLAPDVSGDGRYVVFQSDAGNLVTGDTNSVTDVFVRDRGAQPGPPAVVVDEPAEGDRVFGSQTLAATVDAAFGATRVDFLVDGAMVGSDTSAPYSIPWDTTTTPDGDHTVTATAVSGGGQTSQSNGVRVTIVNNASCPQKLDTDFQSGAIGVDEFVSSGIKCLFIPSLVGGRYSSTGKANADTTLFKILQHWDETTQATKDDVSAFMHQFDAGGYVQPTGQSLTTQTSSHSGIRQTSPFSTKATNLTIQSGTIDCPALVSLCTYTTSDNYFKISYVRQGFDGAIDPTDQQDLYGNPSPNGVPDRIDGLERSLRIALAKYTDSATQTWTGVTNPLGFVPPVFPVDIQLQKLFGVASGTDVTPPGFFGVIFGFDMYLDPVAGNLTSQPRHELFHTIQWRYADRTDYFNRSGTPFWAEATAEWALEQANFGLTGDDAEDYAVNLPDFLGDPSATLEAHASWTDTNDHEYGAFVFANYLDQRFPSQNIIRRTWEKVEEGSGLGADEAIDDVLRNQFGQPDGIAGVLPGFWESVYPFTGFDASKVSVWRQILSRDDRTAPDYSLARAHHKSLQLLGGQTILGSSRVETGGAAFVDFRTPLGRAGTMQLRVANFEPGGLFTSDQPSDEDVKLTLYSFSSYPDLCRTPVVLTLSGGMATSPPIALDSSCTFSTLVITNARVFGGGDKLQEFTASYRAAAAPGDVFVSDPYGFVDIYRPDGTRVAIWDTGRSGPLTGSAFDPAGNFYVTNFWGGTVTKFAPDGTLLGSWGSGYGRYPESIVFDASGTGYVGIVGEEYPYNTGSIQERASDGTLVQTFGVALDRRGADWLALRPNGCTMVYTSEGTRVLQYDVCANQQLGDFARASGGWLAGVGLLPDGGAVVAGQYIIRRFDAQGNQVRTYDSPGPSYWFPLALDPGVTSFWTAGGDTGEVVRFDIATGNKLASFSSGFAPPCPGGSCVGGLSTMPNLVGAASLTVPNSTEVSPKVTGAKLPDSLPESVAGPRA
jgi:archaellum component FlaF (FlaF/FlaG flagellin family)